MEGDRINRVMKEKLLFQLGAAGLGMARAAVSGVPAVRAAINGVRLGAGPQFAIELVERVGVSVLPMPAQLVAKGLIRGGKKLGIVLARNGNVLRAEAGNFVAHGQDGVSVAVGQGGKLAAAASEDTIRSIARSSARTALKGIGRAAMQGAFTGAVLDGGIALVSAMRASRRGEIDGRTATAQVLLSASRGAVAGAVGVGAAGFVSAAVAFTGLSIAGAPVVLPIATMVAVGAVTSRAFDARVREPMLLALNPPNPPKRVE